MTSANDHGLETDTGLEGHALAVALERLVDAADDYEKFVTTAEAVLIDLVDADASAYAHIDYRNWSVRTRWTEDRADYRALMQRYHQLMERKTVWAGSPSGAPHQFSDFLDDPTLYETAIYRDVLKPLHINRGAVVGIRIAANVGINFGIYRQSRAPFPASALENLRRIRPALCRLFGLSLVNTWSRLSPADKLDGLDLPLTPRQRDVAKLLVQGNSSDQTAKALGISAETSRNHIRSIYDRLAVSNRVDLALALTSRPPDSLPVSGCVTVGP
ncbi:MAG: helix-turn-helix transcriptional regulator [Pseudomonadota bacterium]